MHRLCPPSGVKHSGPRWNALAIPPARALHSCEHPIHPTPRSRRILPSSVESSARRSSFPAYRQPGRADPLPRQHVRMAMSRSRLLHSIAVCRRFLGPFASRLDRPPTGSYGYAAGTGFGLPSAERPRRKAAISLRVAFCWSLNPVVARPSMVLPEAPAVRSKAIGQTTSVGS
jgi:hypothetical protein